MEFSEKNRPHASNRDIAILDEWDCLIKFLRKCDTSSTKDGLFHVIEEYGRSDSWVEKWTTGRAGLYQKGQSSVLEGLIPYLKKWALTNLKTTEEEFIEFRHNFFQKTIQLKKQNFEFIGRSAEIDAIATFFRAGENALCLTAKALNGFGGQGKTAIAYEYAYTHAHLYSAIILIDAHDLATFEQRSKFADILPRIDDENFQARVRHYFRELADAYRGEILILIDDFPFERGSSDRRTRAEDLFSSLIKALPNVLHRRFQFLLTSRREILPKLVNNMLIEQMTREDAVELFKSRSGYKKLKIDDDALVNLVEHLLGGHPLSIALIASYARENRIKDISTLISIVSKRLVEAKELQGYELEEYPASLYATFKISFDAVGPEAQYLLLMFTMFRRSTIAMETVKRCIKEMTPKTSEALLLKTDLTQRSGSSKSLNTLIKHDLVELVNSMNGLRRSRFVRVRLHEVIFDFVQTQWAILKENEEENSWLKDIEVSLTSGACRYASTQINQETIQFADIDTLTGFLLPQVRPTRGIIPSLERIDAALEFWFDHFKFQNFVYDTGIQELLLDQMIDLKDYLEETGAIGSKFKLILFKLIGHAYYADPTQTGSEARSYFDQALEVARILDNEPKEVEQKAAILWYKIFLLDHRSNVASKCRQPDEQVHTIRDDPAFISDFDEIEATLPEPLKLLTVAPYRNECELLLRAAHYWGHRGNQDSFIIFRRYEENKLGLDWKGLVDSACQHYIRALNYRLLVIRLFRGGQFERLLARPCRNNQLPFVTEWLNAVKPFKTRVGYEGFTSLSQGIGDAAHQYRGQHFVYVIDYLTTQDQERRRRVFQDAKKAYEGALLLWDIAEKSLVKDEVLLKYRLWMSSSKILMNLLECIEKKVSVPNIEDVLKTLDTEVKILQKTMKSVYGHSVNQQSVQLKAIWACM